MKRQLSFKLLVLIVLLVVGIWTVRADADIITFNEFGLSHGSAINDAINNQYLANFGVTITADNFYIAGFQEAVIFDSTETRTQDPDLEDPWSSGNISPSENLGNFLIIQEQYSTVPDDEGRRPAGTLNFSFNSPLESIGFDLIDVEGAGEYNGPLDAGSDSGFFMAFYMGVSPVATVGFGDFINPASSFYDPTIAYGDNSANRIDPILASQLGLSQFDRVVINLGGSGAIDNINFNSTPVPEPATMLLLGTGLIGLAGWRRKNKKV